MTPAQGLAFVRTHGVVLQAARGPVPSLAEAIVGGAIRGSWWGHPRGREIFRVSEAVSSHPDVLVCKLIGGHVTFVHRRVWPALVKLASRFQKTRLARVFNEHTETGAHRSRSIPFPRWVPIETKEEASRLSVAQAERLLPAVVLASGLEVR
jgi:hypothetical protein